MKYDPNEIYEVTGWPGTFIAMRVREADGEVYFHDTARTRILRKKAKLTPLTLASWNKYARKKFNASAPRFDTREKLISALKSSIRR